MLAEWSVECAPDDPVLVVPWSSEASPSESSEPHGQTPSHFPASHFPASHFVDLRENPYDLDHLPEAEQFPPLMHALRALNAARSPVFTAKCDAWPLDPEELDVLRVNLDVLAEEAAAGFGSYIDILWRERSLFTSFHLQEQMLHRLTRHTAPLQHPYALLDCIIRPAMVDLTGPQEGFAVS